MELSEEQAEELINEVFNVVSLKVLLVHSTFM